MEEKPEVPIISEIPEEKLTSEKGYYHGVYVILNFNKEGSVDSEEEQEDAEQNLDGEDMEDVKLDYER